MAFSASASETAPPFGLWTTEKPYRLDDPLQRQLIAVFTGVISVLGIPGNALVILAVFLSRKLQTSTNAFVTNLAFSDLITCLVLPFNTIALLNDDWPLPDAVCKVVGAVTYITVGASVVNLALIAFNRFYLITRPRPRYDKLYRRRNVVLMIMFSWLYVILVVCVPPACGLGNLGYSERYRACTTDSEHPLAVYNEFLRSLLVQILFLFVVSVCYLLILSHLLKKKRTVGQNARQNSPSKSKQVDQIHRQLEKRQMKVTKNLFIIVCAYVCCILPFGVVCILPRSYEATPWASMLALLNACVNPFIYGLNHPQFKKVFKRIGTCKVKEFDESARFTGPPSSVNTVASTVETNQCGEE